MLRIDSDLRDTASEALNASALALRDARALHAVLGKRAELELRDHFIARGDEPNRNGWPKQNFWQDIAKATALYDADEDRALVIIADGRFNQKYYGGTITPKEAKNLALPAIAAAYGESPLQHDLTPLFRRVNGEARAIALQDRSGTIWFWLVRSVTQEADEEALPDEDQFVAALTEEADDFFARREARKT